MNKVVVPALIGLAIMESLGGCASTTPRPDVTISGAPVKPAEQVARLSRFADKTWPGKVFETDWGYSINKIDGKSIPDGSRIVQLAPGEHKIEYKCWKKFSSYDTGGANNEGTIVVSLDAGKTYYGWVVGRMIAYESFRAAGIKSTGQCNIDYFSTKYPS